MKEVKLPSGAILKITPSPFKDARALYQALLKEGVNLQFDPMRGMTSVYKDLFCIGFSSPQIEACIWKCLERCTYNDGKGDLKVTEDSFEPVASRDDYLTVCMEVTQENVLPFLKSLWSKLKPFLTETLSTPQ